MEASDKISRFGSREDVAAGRAQMTRGHLTKEQLVLDEKTGRYKSVNMIENGKRLAARRKTKAGETPVPERPSVQQEVSKIEQRLASVQSHDFEHTETQLTPEPKKSRAKKVTVSSKSELRTAST